MSEFYIQVYKICHHFLNFSEVLMKFGFITWLNRMYTLNGRVLGVLTPTKSVQKERRDARNENKC